MALVDQWAEIERGLPENWTRARLQITLDDERRLSRAKTLLGPLAPAVHGATLRFVCARRGLGPGPAAVRRLLARLDAEGIRGRLELVDVEEAPAAQPAPPRSLAESWDALLATLPEDWSDLVAELELTSSDHLDPAAVLLAPLNPARHGSGPVFRFRCARRSGYGASPSMVRRCLARLDEAAIPGELRLVLALSDTRPVATQGPVWYVGGKVL